MSDDAELLNETAIPNADEPEVYDAWFRQQVEEGLREAHAPGAVWHTAEEVNARMARLRAERQQHLLEKAS